MNNDLISRSKLIEELIAYRDHTYQTSVYWAIDDVIDRVNEQPIVYDVERVVKEIQEATYCDLDEEDYDNGYCVIDMDTVLDIVKRGGIDEN